MTRLCWILVLLLLPRLAGAQTPVPVLGEQPITILRLYYPSQPNAEPATALEQAVIGADAHMRVQSQGKAWLNATITPWLQIQAPSENCSSGNIQLYGSQTAAAAGITTRGVTVYYVPMCNRNESGVGSRWAIISRAHPRTLLHEVSHGLGLRHPQRESCVDGVCQRIEGDELDIMAPNFTAELQPYNAFERHRFGWLDVPDLTASGPVTLQPGGAVRFLLDPPYAPNLSAPATYYWIELRTTPTPAIWLRADHGVLSVLKDLDPGTAQRDSVFAQGETFTDTLRKFAITMTRVDANGAVLLASLGASALGMPSAPRLKGLIRDN